MISLGVDTSSSQGSLCLLKGQKLLAQQKWMKQSSHSELITEKYLQVLAEANLTPKEIKQIYCVVGPGSFTGIRVGVSFCKALAYSLNLPIFPVESLKALALSTSQLGIITSLINAQKNSFFFSKFKKTKDSLTLLKNNELIEIHSLKNNVDEKTICCGDGFPRYESFLEDSLKKFISFDETATYIDLVKVIQWNEKYSLFKTSSWLEVHAFYIRPSAAEEKLLLKS